ncbi:fumarylpyruvate hydrolase [Rhodothalassium salexigens DSM 2132]|uniref:Fumarylpyruvate hydrolase n=1 Tax=Rhodothalassium salexigens DSM 2132 TaxID=1188247 RepID=A0A4V2SP24_RHOSA|nr:fumarylacetoacetate hydrolase family protein [Rhodothalassium salexigens]MBB4211880.1 fumarylpyruvate hydrolase [Rhodothalassium salexigens DSM 2132]MBK1638921.1 fumarylacetoacetate hydrolase [Rhodothalassium salexigens DSM 2132]TCP33536.1 fumarylpyruvate hydrolase [Rhodothalassium salexigens DSM 2132]
MPDLFPVPSVPTLPIAGREARFPVRRIYCVARNYAAHALEMGMDPEREPPFFFMKPADALVPGDADVPYPPQTDDLHHEVELVAAIGTGGRDIAPEVALDHVYGYAVGNDLTRRDLQAAARARGQPWDTAKGFDHSAPVSALQPAERIGHPSTGAVRLRVGDTLRQDGDLSQLIWTVPEIVALLSGLFTLHPGDLVFTGTPAGVGAVRPGETMVAEVEGVGQLVTRIV